jgi:hypothetical protein
MFVFAFTAAAQNWPSFRGPDASGAADGQKLPVTWDIEKGTNIAWKTPIAGLAHSSPIVWGDRIFLTAAEDGKTEEEFNADMLSMKDELTRLNDQARMLEAVITHNIQQISEDF